MDARKKALSASRALRTALRLVSKLQRETRENGNFHDRQGNCVETRKPPSFPHGSGPIGSSDLSSESR